MESRTLFSGTVATGTVPWMQESGVSSAFAVKAAAAVAPVVSGLLLINADTDQVVGPLTSGEVIDFSALGTHNLNVRADTSPAVVGSVRFALDANSNFRTENTAVYAFAGNNGNDYLPWTPTTGAHTIAATAWTGANATGSAGAARTSSFTVIDGGTPTVSVTATDATASEPGTDTGTFTIIRTGSTAKALTVNVLPGGTAGNGSDYKAVASSVTIPAGSASAALSIVPIDDTVYEGTETATLTIQPGTGYTPSTASGAAAVNISDNDPAPTNPGQSPFLGSPFALPTTIQLEDFDNGGQGVSYSDVDPTNVGGAYRTNVGVDIEATTDTGGGYNLGHVRAGEWVEYTVNVPTAGTYDLGIRFATASGGGTASLQVDGTNVSGAITLPATGGWQTWQTIKKTGVNLPAGQHVLRLSIDTSVQGGDAGNLNWLQITASAATPVAPTWPTSWQSAASAPSPRFESSSIVFGGKVYAFGGFKNSNFQVDRTYVNYDPATNKWTSLGTLPVGMAETHLGVTTDGQYIYFAGGFGGDLNQTTSPSQWISSDVWRFDPVANTWLKIATLPQPRGAGALELVGRSLHYLAGNPADRVTNVADHFVYNLDTKVWTTAAAVPDPKDHASGLVLNGKIYYMGGEHGHDQLHLQQSDAHVYDPATNTWTRIADMPIAKSHTEGGTFVSDGKIIWAGGQIDNFQPTSNVIAYDPASNSWVTLAPLPEARQGDIVARVGNKIIFTLGGTQTNSPQSETWIGLLP